MIEIRVDSQFEHYCRYDVIVMCGGFNKACEQEYVASTQKTNNKGTTLLEVDDAYSIEVIVYIVPISLPEGKNEQIADHLPFEVTLTITSHNKQIYNTIHKINAWGGSSIKLNIDLSK